MKGPHCRGGGEGLTAGVVSRATKSVLKIEIILSHPYPQGRGRKKGNGIPSVVEVKGSMGG